MVIALVSVKSNSLTRYLIVLPGTLENWLSLSIMQLSVPVLLVVLEHPLVLATVLPNVGRIPYLFALLKRSLVCPLVLPEGAYALELVVYQGSGIRVFLPRTPNELPLTLLSINEEAFEE